MRDAVLIGLGATLFIDLWAQILKRASGVRSLDYCLLGRWLLHMPEGRFVHASIAAAPSKPFECPVGWVSHYTIGAIFAVVFVLITGAGWTERPALLPALVFGIATAAIPLFVMQPAFGLGIASSKTPSPNRARLKSLTTHAVFGLGLYCWAYLLA